MTAVVVTALPAAPNRATDSPATFASKADAMMTGLVAFVPQVNAAGVQVSSDSAVAAAAAVSTAADNAAVQANTLLAATYAAATAWAAGTYAQFAVVFSPLDYQVYRKKTATSSTSTDPSLDSTNWGRVSPAPAAANLYLYSLYGGL